MLLNELMYAKHLEQCQAHNKSSINISFIMIMIVIIILSMEAAKSDRTSASLGVRRFSL